MNKQINLLPPHPVPSSSSHSEYLRVFQADHGLPLLLISATVFPSCSFYACSEVFSSWSNVRDAISIASFSNCYPLIYSICPPTAADSAFVVYLWAFQVRIIWSWGYQFLWQTSSTLTGIRHLNLPITSWSFFDDHSQQMQIYWYRKRLTLKSSQPWLGHTTFI